MAQGSCDALAAVSLIHTPFERVNKRLLLNFFLLVFLSISEAQNKGVMLVHISQSSSHQFAPQLSCNKYF